MSKDMCAMTIWNEHFFYSLKCIDSNVFRTYFLSQYIERDCALVMCRFAHDILQSLAFRTHIFSLSCIAALLFSSDERKEKRKNRNELNKRMLSIRNVECVSSTLLPPPHPHVSIHLKSHHLLNMICLWLAGIMQKYENIFLWLFFSVLFASLRSLFISIRSMDLCIRQKQKHKPERWHGIH